MTRAQLEHIIRAAATIAEDDEIVVFGSQAILGQFPDAPDDLLESMEADVFPRSHPDRAELIEGTIGEISPFHETFGYYAQGVGPETAVLPAGWESRLVAVRTPATRGATGLCLEVHDLAISKYVAGREKDSSYLEALIRHDLVQETTLLDRLEGTPVDEERRLYIARLIRRDFDLNRAT